MMMMFIMNSVRTLANMNYTLYASMGTADFYSEHGIRVKILLYLMMMMMIMMMMMMFIMNYVRTLANMNYTLYASMGTADLYSEHGIRVKLVICDDDDDDDDDDVYNEFCAYSGQYDL